MKAWDLPPHLEHTIREIIFDNASFEGGKITRIFGALEKGGYEIIKKGEPKAASPRFEYSILTTAEGATGFDELARLGREGWELVSGMMPPNERRITYVFKRQL